jgi:5'-deoxy-5'-methylthioadenosine phosphorylase
MFAIIGGSGLTQLANLTVTRRLAVRTPYGEPSGPLTFGNIAGREIVFLARHGYGHTIPPHQVNYRANIWALHEQGVKDVIGIASVGGISADLQPGVLVVPDQIIDYTHGRAATFYTFEDRGVQHVDFTWPYAADLRLRCISAAQRVGVPVVDGGVYAATQGPRLETAAEINRLERDGAAMVGMTGMPEAILAREIGLPYAAIAVVANHAAGRGGSATAIAMGDVAGILDEAMAKVRSIIETMVSDNGR